MSSPMKRRRRKKKTKTKTKKKKEKKKQVTTEKGKGFSRPKRRQTEQANFKEITRGGIKNLVFLETRVSHF